jgi:hypothetical protein
VEKFEVPQSKIQHSKRLIFYTLFAICFFLTASSCKAGAPVEPVVSPLPDVTSTLTLTPTDTIQPTATQTPPRALLISPPGSDVTDVEALQSKLKELAAQDGLLFEKREQVNGSDLGENVRLVVILAPDPGVQNLAQAYPDVQFLALGISGLDTAPNLSVIGSGGQRPDQQGFLAGYLAAVITQDWRVGALTPAGTPAGNAARLGFVNGTIFYCGLCRPAYPPFLQYPVTIEMPAGADQAEQQVIVDNLVASVVKTVYISPGASDLALLDLLAQAGINVIGSTPQPEELADRWVATLRVDLISAVEQVWPRLIAGEGGVRLDVPLVLTDRNEALFSSGRQGLVEKFMADLAAGFIDTGVDPATGEAR